MNIDDKIAEELKEFVLENMFVRDSYGPCSYICMFCAEPSDAHNIIIKHSKDCKGRVFAEALGEHFPYHPGE